MDTTARAELRTLSESGTGTTRSSKPEASVHCGYVETFYLPVIGPSATYALRRLAGMATASSELTISLDDFAGALGLGHGTGHNAPVVRALERLLHFGLARWQRDVLEVRQSVPRLSERQLRRLPLVLQAAARARPRRRVRSVRISYTY